MLALAVTRFICFVALVDGFQQYLRLEPVVYHVVSEYLENPQLVPANALDNAHDDLERVLHLAEVHLLVHVLVVVAFEDESALQLRSHPSDVTLVALNWQLIPLGLKLHQLLQVVFLVLFVDLLRRQVTKRSKLLQL